MLPISNINLDVCRSIVGVLADIDDTISTNGQLTPIAYNAMAKVRCAGLLMIPVTGRPAGWCDHIARMWPVDGVVGENGAFYFHYDRKNKKLAKRMVSKNLGSEDVKFRLKKIAHRIFEEVPEASFASDQQYRVADIAIDFCEDVESLSQSQINLIVKIMENEGLTVKVSSIHINGWFGNYDKLTMSKTLMDECFKIDLELKRNQFIFIGDSPNDQPMFEFFPNSIGVANISNFLNKIDHKPRYVAHGAAGAGFAEIVDFIIASRNAKNL